jgi:hypothetical protein
VIGNRLAGSDPKGWNRRDVGATTFFESEPVLSVRKPPVFAFHTVLNWGGNGRYVRELLARTAVAVTALGALALALTGAAMLAARAGLLTAAQLRPVAAGMLWLATLTGAPLYLLRRDGELYFGGSSGLVTDTFYSLIERSFYGRVYAAAQIPLVFGGVVATIAIFGIVAYLNFRRHTMARVRPAIALLSTMALVSGLVVAQHLLLGTPYLQERTALLYIPMFVLFTALTWDGVAARGRVGNILSTVMLAPLLAMAMYHYAMSANVHVASDWPGDADTKSMIADVSAVLRTERPSESPGELEVFWQYWPVAAVYARRRGAVPLDVEIEPAPHEGEFLYLPESEQRERTIVVNRYPTAHTILLRRIR